MAACNAPTCAATSCDGSVSGSLRSWNQIKADVLGIPVIQVPGDATAVGITMLAGLGVGVYRSPGEAVAAACHPAEPVLPDHANQDRYHALYERYRAVVASDLARPDIGPGQHSGPGSVPRPEL